MRAQAAHSGALVHTSGDMHMPVWISAVFQAAFAPHFDFAGPWRILFAAPKRRRALSMSLLHINMVAMTVVCVSLMVGFSYRESRWGILLMQLAVLGLMGVIVYDIRVISAST
jgi:hypothetical protein